MNVGNAIRELRKAKGLSQDELAKSAGITQTALSQIENGQRPGIKTLKAICRKLGISEGLIYLMALEKADVPREKNILYEKLFPVIKGLVTQIVLTD